MNEKSTTNYDADIRNNSDKNPPISLPACLLILIEKYIFSVFSNLAIDISITFN